MKLPNLKTSFKFVFVITGLTGWVFWAHAQGLYQLALQGLSHYESSTTELSTTTRVMTHNFIKMAKEKKELSGRVARIQSALEQAVRDKDQMSASNSGLRADNKNLRSENADLMSVNRMLARQVQELEEAVVMLKNRETERGGWMWPFAGGSTSSKDKKVLAELRDEKLDLAAENRALKEKLDSLYQTYRQQLEAAMESGEIPANLAVAKSDRRPKSDAVDLGTLSLSKSRSSFVGPVRNTASAADQSSPSIPFGEARVVSVDSNEGFLIIDLGTDAGVRVGQKFTAKVGRYRIAELEVIETRESFSACNLRYIDPYKPFNPDERIILIES